MVSPLSHSQPEQWNKGAVGHGAGVAALCGRRLGRGWGPADAVAAGALAAEEALRQAGVAAGENAHEVDVEGTDGAVLLGDPGEGAGELVDVVLAVCLAHVYEAALLLQDAGRLVHPLRERP